MRQYEYELRQYECLRAYIIQVSAALHRENFTDVGYICVLTQPNTEHAENRSFGYAGINGNILLFHD